jgi:hypothetical protein
MTNIIDFPTPEDTETPINHNALMDFAEAWAIDTEEELTALNEWMVQHHLNDLEDDDEDDDAKDPNLTLLENAIYPKFVVEFLEENGIRCDEDMIEFTQMIHVLTAEPNVPLLVMN